jgi:hypothetical protein
MMRGLSGEIRDFRWAILDEAKAPLRPSSVRARFFKFNKSVDVRAWIEVDRLATLDCCICTISKTFRDEIVVIRSSMTV